MRTQHALRSIAALLTLVGLLATAGCRRSPSSVCDKLLSLTQKGGDAWTDKDACVQMMKEIKERDGAAYDCTADCVLAAGDARTASACLERCAAQ